LPESCRRCERTPLFNIEGTRSTGVNRRL